MRFTLSSQACLVDRPRYGSLCQAPIKGRAMGGDSVSISNIRRVGLIGLGKMGQPMARLLCQRGFTVAGFDVDEGAMEAVAAFGVQTALSPQAVAAASDLVIIAVGFDAEVEAVMFGERG